MLEMIIAFMAGVLIGMSAMGVMGVLIIKTWGGDVTDDKQK